MRTLGQDEDVHFYLDNAPPEEVAWVLRCLSKGDALSPQMIAVRLYAEYGRMMQKDKTYSPRRLHDLGLARQVGVGTRISYLLTDQGLRLLDIMAIDAELYAELMHFLHYARFDGQLSTRKYFWSYRRCCEQIWGQGRLVPTQELAAVIQGLMEQEFPNLDFGARKGARFDDTASRRFYAWIRQLSPPPFCEVADASLHPRTVQRHELVMLALDYVYRARGYRYGDPVVLDDKMLDELARVFFLEHGCCRELLALASKLTRSVVLRDTFAGTSVSLMTPYSIENL